VLLALVPSAEATTFTVDTKKDLLDANQVDGICAANNGKCSVRAATMAANGNPGLDDIVIPAGKYELTRAPQDAPSSLEGDLDLDDAVVITGAGSRETIIRQTVEDRVIISNATPAGFVPGALITGLTITGGRITEPGNQVGGGILAEDFLLGIDDVTVRDNRILRTVGNSFGGGVGAMDPATLVIQDSKISGNMVKLRSETAAAVGGGVWVNGDFPDGSTGSTITDTEITNNKVSVKPGGVGVGGGLNVRDPITITRTVISGNVADEGGGLSVTPDLESAVIDSSTISGNRASEGAGVNVGTQDPVTFTNSTISSNELVEAPGWGGGALYTRLADITMEHVTVAENKSSRKRALVLDSVVPGAIELELTGSAVAGPHRDCKFKDANVDRELNVFGDASCAPPGISTNLVANPELKPLADNPGAFPAFNLYGQTHMPKNGSPVVGFVGSGCPPPAQDQLGFDRIGPCDAGAVERPGV
jgi:hypothetical protein